MKESDEDPENRLHFIVCLLKRNTEISELFLLTV